MEFFLFHYDIGAADYVDRLAQNKEKACRGQGGLHLAAHSRLGAVYAGSAQYSGADNIL